MDALSPLQATRKALGSSADPRVERTRQAIVDGVHRLLAEGDGSGSISVADIVRASGVSRSSFYAHFEDVDDVASYLLRDAFARIRTLYADARRAATMAPVDAMRLSQVRLVEHFVENRALFAALSTRPLARGVKEETTRAMAEEILLSFETLDVVPAGTRADLAAVYVANAAVGLLDAWMRGDVTATAEEVVAHLMSLMPAWLAQGGAPDPGRP